LCGSWLALFFGALFLFPAGLQAQDTSAPFLLPQTVFVGDAGRLVVPLGQAFAGVEPFVLETPETLPESPDLVIRRIELERRGGTSRLLIDFIPYSPGTLSLPAMELFSRGEDPGESSLTLSGLEVQIASILDPARMALSEPATPLAVPGTSLLVYGSIILLLALLFLGIAISIWSKRNFWDLWYRLRRRHHLSAMMRFLRRLANEAGLEKKGNPGYYLSLLAAEFREFLSAFTGTNCRSLTAGEFLELPLIHDNAAQDRPFEPLLTPAFLCRLFRGWDTLRFSGRVVDKIDLFQALKETEKFIIALDRVEREKIYPKPVLKFAPDPVLKEGL